MAALLPSLGLEAGLWSWAVPPSRLLWAGEERTFDSEVVTEQQLQHHLWDLRRNTDFQAPP